VLASDPCAPQCGCSGKKQRDRAPPAAPGRIPFPRRLRANVKQYGLR